MSEEEKRADDVTTLPAPSQDDIAEAEVIADIAEDKAATVEDRNLSVPPDRRRSGGMLGALIGGIVAAALGFGLARVVPGGWPIQDTSALDARITAQSQELASLKADLNALAARPVPDPSAEIATLRAGLEERLAESSAAVNPAPAIAEVKVSLQAAIAALDARLTEVEKRPTGPGGGASATALAAYDRELQALRDQIAAQPGDAPDVRAQLERVVADAKAQFAAATQAAEKIKAEAVVAGRAATVAVALGRIRAALDGGGPYAAAAADLGQAGVQVPADLAGLAATGIPTLTDLQRRFPEAARVALDVALRSNVGTGWSDRVTSFLRTQTGARSLTPREGTDPDAVLSRAEAAVNAGDVAAALTEISTLPDVVQAPLAAWVADAKAREAATAAVAALAAAADSQ